MRPLVARFGVLALTAAVACQAAQAPGPQASSGPSASTVAASPSPTPAASPTVRYPSREGTCAMRVSESFTLANDMTCAGDGMVIVADNLKIGRASCRERVEISAVAGSLQRQSEDEHSRTRWA